MEESKVKLDTMDKIKNFVHKVAQFPEDIELAVDQYVVDAKSVLGVTSIAKDEPMNMRVHADGKRLNLILSELEEFRGD